MTEHDDEYWIYDTNNPPLWAGTKMIGPFQSRETAKTALEMMEHGLGTYYVANPLRSIRHAVRLLAEMEQLRWPKGFERR